MKNPLKKKKKEFLQENIKRVKKLKETLDIKNGWSTSSSGL